MKVEFYLDLEVETMTPLSSCQIWGWISFMLKSQIVGKQWPFKTTSSCGGRYEVRALGLVNNIANFGLSLISLFIWNFQPPILDFSEWEQKFLNKFT